MSTVYDEIRVDNVLSAPPPPPPPPPVKADITRSDAHGYSIVKKTNKGSFTQSCSAAQTKNMIVNETTDSSEMHLMNPPTMSLNQPSPRHNPVAQIDDLDSALPVYMNATRQPTLDSSERPSAKKSSSQEFGVVSSNDDRFFSMSQGEENGYTMPTTHRALVDNTQKLLPAPYEEFSVTPNHDKTAGDKSSHLPLEESLYSNINDSGQSQTSHSRARSERIKRGNGRKGSRLRHVPTDDSAL